MPRGLPKAFVRGGAASLVVFVPVLLALFGSWDREPRLQRVGLSDWEEIQRSSEEEVLVAYVWASWCEPCVELLPTIAELQREYEGRARFVALCLDNPGDSDSLAFSNQLLVESEARFEHYVFEEDFPETLEQLDIPKVPAALLFSADSGRRSVLLGDELNNELSPADLQDVIDSLVLREGELTGRGE